MFEQAFKNIDDVLWKDAGCTSELDYTEQTSWLLFLKYLDSLEQNKAMEAKLGGKKYAHIIEPAYWDCICGVPEVSVSTDDDSMKDEINMNRVPSVIVFVALQKGGSKPKKTETLPFFPTNLGTRMLEANGQVVRSPYCN